MRDRLGTGSHWHGSDGHSMCDDWRGRICAAFDPHFNISSLELKLGDIFFYQEIDKLFQLFLIHECIRLSSFPACAITAPAGFRHGVKA
jgi:hypothetical protein